ncbi:permease prefix domain 1-containing protein [Dactylosporangium sp. NBC_01737]|uniref:permease prefix domain 1-containing protein n=1 Tax=Dactylosporangium sp. NBC_01737 TaxID=2975959 RepID=UPI002E15E4C2|nr:permease prefix domain 1-containing protein [Dactylosporangium sp. NBC_01737]
MAGHRLIDASITELARRLPADAVDELADGLTETYQHHLSIGLDPDAAAEAAIAEFGDPEQVVAAFVRHAPGRRAARVLLCSGPVVGGCWCAAIVTGHAWTWPVPAPVPFVFGLTLLAVVVALVLAATASRSYRRTRAAAAGGLGMIVIDAAVLAAVALAAPAFAWPLTLAAAASLARVALTIRLLPPLFTG